MKKVCISLLLAAGLAAPALTLADNGQDTAARLLYLEQRVEELSRRVLALEQQNRQQQHIIIENRRQVPPTYACRVSVFGKNYESLDQNQGLARHRVRQACNAEQSSIFCTDRDIKCETYR
ncbi:MAG: hypothetical protein Q4A62_03650 [Eikenella sp.]|nr:hypothetical protein [Eikenella sp.]